jgi:phage baseplate assembly protein W
MGQVDFLGQGWAFPVGADARGRVALAADEDDIRQAILIILVTEPGERVMRPQFGAGLRQFVFEPINTATLALLQHRVEQALVTWEPRIDSVTVQIDATLASTGRLDITIGYRIRASNTLCNLVYPFFLQEGAP